MELKPCPFCGSKNLVRNFFTTEGIISCSCGATMKARTEEEHYVQIGEDIYRKIPRKLGGAIASEAWNRRANE